MCLLRGLWLLVEERKLEPGPLYGPRPWVCLSTTGAFVRLPCSVLSACLFVVVPVRKNCASKGRGSLCSLLFPQSRIVSAFLKTPVLLFFSSFLGS